VAWLDPMRAGCDKAKIVDNKQAATLCSEKRATPIPISLPTLTHDHTLSHQRD
jgi:hypothetical protein